MSTQAILHPLLIGVARLLPLSCSALSDSRSAPIAPNAATINDTKRIFLRLNLLRYKR